MPAFHQKKKIVRKTYFPKFFGIKMSEKIPEIFLTIVLDVKEKCRFCWKGTLLFIQNGNRKDSNSNTQSEYEHLFLLKLNFGTSLSKETN